MKFADIRIDGVVYSAGYTVEPGLPAAHGDPGHAAEIELLELTPEAAGDVESRIYAELYALEGL